MIGKISLGNVTTFESKLKQHYFTRNCHNVIFAWYSYGVKLLHCHIIASFLAPNQFFCCLIARASEKRLYGIWEQDYNHIL